MKVTNFWLSLFRFFYNEIPHTVITLLYNVTTAFSNSSLHNLPVQIFLHSIFLWNDQTQGGIFLPKYYLPRTRKYQFATLKWYPRLNMVIFYHFHKKIIEPVAAAILKVWRFYDRWELMKYLNPKVSILKRLEQNYVQQGQSLPKMTLVQLLDLRVADWLL